MPLLPKGGTPFVLPRPPFTVALLLVAGLALLLPQPDDQPVPAVAEIALPEAEAAHDSVELHHETITVKAGDTLARLLGTRGVDAASVHNILNAGAEARAFSAIRAGASLDLIRDADGQVVELTYAQDALRTVTVRRDADGTYGSELTEKQAVTVTRYADGTIEDSLFGSGKRAGIGDGVILKMADVFGYDIDFALEVQRGDSFRVLFEEVIVDGRKIRDGNLLSAEFINQGKIYRAVRFAPDGSPASYYTPDGLALRKAFLRSPVDFARISSRFNPNRRHPVLHTLRAHKGVDYAAGRGTPVRATANGRVEYAGNKGGYGKTVVLQHGNRYSTLYAHLDRFAANVRNGTRVTQGQIIGYVGSTGLSTGPHLHYEFRVGGVHVDPLKQKPVQAEPIAAAERSAFLAEAGRLMAMMDSMGGRTAVAQTTRPDNRTQRF